MRAAYVAGSVIVPQCSIFLSPSPMSLLLPPPALSLSSVPRLPLRPIIVIHKSPSSHNRTIHTKHCIVTRVSWVWETRCQRRPVTCAAACAFRASRFRFRAPGARAIDKSNAYPSRPRDGLRFAPAAQRRRDPWRHRELNPHPTHAPRLGWYSSAPRHAIWFLPLFSPILTLRLPAVLVYTDAGCVSLPANFASANGKDIDVRCFYYYYYYY